MRFAATIILAMLAFSGPAHAAGLVGLLAGPGTLTIAGLAVNSLGFRLLATVALSALSRALRKKPRPPGIQTQFPTDGGTNPQSFILGFYASEGNKTAPNYSHGSVGGTPLAYLTIIRDFGDVPGQTLSRVMINKEYVTLDETEHPDFGKPVIELREGSTDYAWVKYYDGTQVAADPYLLATYGADPDRPWTSEMIGLGVPYAIFTFRFNRDKFPGEPSIRAEFTGVPLYDPRKDTSVGGAGSHLWDDPSTFDATTNPQVIKYNILRGIELPDGAIWGGGVDEDDVPLSNWFAAMNACDAIADGETEAQYRAGFEVKVSDEPADVLKELDVACAGQTVEIGGMWKTRTGGPGLPVYYFTDGDVIISKDQELDPFPALENTHNGVQATFPDPDSLWNSKEAPARYNAAWEADDLGQRLVADLQLNAVPYPDQVQRLMRSYIENERRFRGHAFSLPPDAAILEPLDVVSYTSVRNQYTDEHFEVVRSEDNQVNCNQRLAVRETSSSDFLWSSGYLLPTSAAPIGRTPPSAQAVAGFSAAAGSIDDGAGSGKRAAVVLNWTATDLDDIRGIRWQIRVKDTEQMVSVGVLPDVDLGQVRISDGILPVTTYEVRARYHVDRPTSWTSWTEVTTGVFLFGYAEITSQVATDIANAKKVPVVETLPADDTTYGPVVLLSADDNIYRWIEGGPFWKAAINAALVDGEIAGSQIAKGAVQTDKIADRAVTNRFSSFTDGSVLLASTTLWDELESLTVDLSGNDVVVGFSFLSYGYYSIDVRLVLDGTTVFDMTVHGGYIDHASIEFAYIKDVSYTVTIPNSVVDSSIDLTLEAKRDQPYSHNSAEITKRSLWTMETKK